MVSLVTEGKINCEPLQKKSERNTLPSYMCPLQVTGAERAISEARTRKVVRCAGPRRGRSTGSALNPSASCGGPGSVDGSGFPGFGCFTPLASFIACDLSLGQVFAGCLQLAIGGFAPCQHLYIFGGIQTSQFTFLRPS